MAIVAAFVEGFEQRCQNQSTHGMHRDILQFVTMAPDLH